MASLKKSNLSKVKKQLLNKNIKTGGPLKFNPDASNKIFQLCKTGKKTFLLLSFQNNPVEYQRYLSCLLYTSPSPRDATLSRMPSSA